MQPDQPLLTIAIPTYNREQYLKALLSILEPQVLNEPRLELILSDNASTDGTEYLARSFVGKSAAFRYIRNETNLGADGNILQCFEQARGKYVWILGDDDTLLPRGLHRVLQILENNDYDLVFLTPVGYSDDIIKEFRHPKIRRPTEKTSNVLRFVRLVNRHSDLIYISSMIVNKSRINKDTTDKCYEWIGSHIVQLGWVMTALNQFRSGLFVESGIIAGRTGNSSGGFHAAKVFGENYARAVEQWITCNPRLRSLLINDQLLLWFPGNWMSISVNQNNISAEDPERILTPVFGGNFRYWLLVYPLLKLPRPLAALWAQLARIFKVISRICYKT